MFRNKVKVKTENYSLINILQESVSINNCKYKYKELGYPGSTSGNKRIK